MKKISPYGLFILFTGMLFYLFEFFLGVFPGTIASELMHDFSLNAEEFSLIGVGYYVVYGLMQVPVGLIVKKLGTRLVLTVASSVCTLGTIWFSFASSFFPVILSRMMMGFGASFAFVSMLVLVLNWFPQKNFGLLAGLSQLIGTIGPILAGGPLAYLLNAFDGDWRLILRGFGGVGCVLTILVYAIIRDKPKKSKTVLVYLKHSQSTRKDLINLLKRKRIWAVVLYAGLVYSSAPLLGAYWGTSFFMTKGYSKEAAATIISLVWVGMALGAVLLGWISDKIKRRRTVLVAAASLGLLASSVLFIPLKWELFSCFLILCLGLGCAGQALSFACATETVPRSLHAACIGLNNCLIVIFSSFIPPFCSSIIQSASIIQNGVVIYTQLSFIKGLIIVPILFALALLISLFKIKETFCHQQHEVHTASN